MSETGRDADGLTALEVQVVERRVHGLSIRAIADEIGAHRSQVHRALSRKHVKAAIRSAYQDAIDAAGNRRAEGYSVGLGALIEIATKAGHPHRVTAAAKLVSLIEPTRVEHSGGVTVTQAETVAAIRKGLAEVDDAALGLENREPEKA